MGFFFAKFICFQTDMKQKVVFERSLEMAEDFFSIENVKKMFIKFFEKL